MQSDQSKRNIADFFKPYARTIPSQTVPQKRLSPFADRGEDEDDVDQARPGWKELKTPTKSVSFKNATPTRTVDTRKAVGSTTPSLGSLPIRSPATVNKIDTTPSKDYQKKLFGNDIPSRPPAITDTKPNLNSSFSLSDISDRSQAVVRNGKVIAVRDSDDEDGSDTDSIQSLDDILGRRDRKQDKKTGQSFDSNGSNANDEAEAERVKLLSKFTNGRSKPIIGKEAIRAIHAKERSLNFDLSRLLDEHFGDMEAMDVISRARAESDSEDGDDPTLTETDKKLLAQMVMDGGDDMDADDVNRVLSAVERTEALAGERTFSFFGWRGMEDLRNSLKIQHFPVNAIPDYLWEPGDDGKRSRAFLSGIMAEKAASGRLHSDLLSWTLQEAIREEQQDLQQSYIKTLQAGSLSWTRLHLTANTIQEIFQDLGAQTNIIRDSSSIASKHHLNRVRPAQSPAHLLSALRVLRAICAHMDMASLSKLTSILMRLSLDETVMSDAWICMQVESLFETLLDLPDADSATYVRDRLLTDASQHLQDPVLQAKLLLHISASGYRAAEIRKTLANIFLTGPSALTSTKKVSYTSLQQLNKHINTAHGFTIIQNSNATPNDYANLTALINILDVAIGAGNPPALTDINIESPDLKAQLLKLETQVGKTPSQDAQQIKSFNADVDALADSLHTIFVSIKDTGASHMRRTEAKDILQALEFRLLYNVRIGTRRKKHVFDTVRNSSGGGGAVTKPNKDKIVGVTGSEHRANERGRFVMGRFLSSALDENG